MSSSIKYLSIPDGKLAYEDRGAGPAVLMIQGVGLAGTAWKPQAEALSSGYRTVCVDNRGVGGSRLPVAGLSVEAMAEDALRLADALHLERFHLIGHSMGGLIAQQMALADTSRVLSLSLLCTFPTGPDGAKLKRGMLWPAVRSAVGTLRSRRLGFLDLIFPKPYLESVDKDWLASDVGEIFGRDLARPPSVVRRQLSAMKRFDVSTKLSTLASIPTLVASGQYDLIAPPDCGRRLSELIPNSHLVLLEGLGHAAPIQNPKRVNALLEEHLKRNASP